MGMKETEPANGPLEQQPPVPCTLVSHEDLSILVLVRTLPEPPHLLRPLCCKSRGGRDFCPFSAQQSLGPPQGSQEDTLGPESHLPEISSGLWLL